MGANFQGTLNPVPESISLNLSVSQGCSSFFSLIFLFCFSIFMFCFTIVCISSCLFVLTLFVKSLQVLSSPKRGNIVVPKFWLMTHTYCKLPDYGC